MATQLEGIKGKFILSLNATPEVREIFGAFSIEEVPVKYSTALKITKMARELIISNCAEDFHQANTKEASNG